MRRVPSFWPTFITPASVLCTLVSLLFLTATSCKGPSQPSLYTDYTHLDYDGQTGGAARVGFNIPLGTGFRDPALNDSRTLAQQQFAATLALIEALSAPADDPGDVGAPSGASPSARPAPEGLHIGDQAAAKGEDDEHLSIDHVTETREELEAWSWRTVGMLAVLGLVSLSLWALYKATGKYLDK